MTATWKQVTGGQIGVTSGVAVDMYELVGLPDIVPAGDYFSYVASLSLIQIPATKFIAGIGQLFRQDIQIHEVSYGRFYRLEAPYGRFKRTAGSYQVTISQQGADVTVTAGVRKGGYGEDGGGPVTYNADGSVNEDKETKTGTVGGARPDKRRSNHGLIGKDGDTIHGVSVSFPKEKIVLQFRHPAGVLNFEYIERIGRLYSKVNADEFLGYAPGEIRFDGGDYSQSPAEATATYRFDREPNTKEDDKLMIGGIHVKEKQGWDVISPIYADETDNKRPVKKIEYIEIIRPAGMEDRNFTDETGFGWGGSLDESEDD